jgi:hypothetical protein
MLRFCLKYVLLCHFCVRSLTTQNMFFKAMLSSPDLINTVLLLTTNHRVVHRVVHSVVHRVVRGEFIRNQ